MSGTGDRSRLARKPRNAGLAIYRAGVAEFAARSACELGGMMSWNMFSRFGAGSDPEIVGFTDLEDAIGTNAWTMVDVREPHEFAAGHIPNALNMPMSSYDPKDLPEGKPVVLICQSGGRSRNALNKARAVGREDVRHFAEGMNGWRSHNGPVTLCVQKASARVPHTVDDLRSLSRPFRARRPHRSGARPDRRRAQGGRTVRPRDFRRPPPSDVRAPGSRADQVR